jgi:cytidylate kinase
MTDQGTRVVTISRQTASGGAYIGHLLARTLGFRYVEREVLHRAAERLGVDIPEASAVEERKTGFIEKIIRGFSFGTPEAAYIPPSRRPVYDHELFRTEAEIIRAIANQYDAVIVGHAGYAVLREHPGATHVFIHAPMDFRIKRLRQFHDLSVEQAQEELEQSDRMREQFLRSMTDTDRYDARNYHLCIDAEAEGFEAAVRMISELAKKTERNRGD